jgi:hypothetical protein
VCSEVSASVNVLLSGGRRGSPAEQLERQLKLPGAGKPGLDSLAGIGADSPREAWIRD